MRYMGKRRNRVCGADVHNDLIVATIQCSDETTLREQFGTTRSELERFRGWLIANKCEQVAFEATGVYWFPVYDVLSPSIDTIVANPWMIKALPKDKSDDHDSKSIASFCLNGQIKRSRVFSNEGRDLRTMTRARSGYVKTRTQFRNRIHKYLALRGIKLRSGIRGIFGKSGRHVLNGLIEGKNIDEILDGIPSGRIRKKREIIRSAIAIGFDDITKFLIKDALEVLDNLENRIENMSRDILGRTLKKSKDLAIVMSVPGISFVSGSKILSEIGDYHDFGTPEQLAKWCGLTPGLNESAGKKRSCGITKQGSKHLRTILVEVAHVVSRMKHNRFTGFFNRIMARKNRNVAIVALARKLICIIYHLLVNQELYDPGLKKATKSKSKRNAQAQESSSEDQLQDKVAAIVDAYYRIDAKNVSKGGG
jgi:transposase